MLSMLLAVVTGLAGLGVERAVVDSEVGAELLSGTGSLAAASTWQHWQSLWTGAHSTS